jgi:hypothetical protein
MIKKNIFEKIGDKIGGFLFKIQLVSGSWHSFWMKNAKLAKIAENCDHNIDPCTNSFQAQSKIQAQPKIRPNRKSGPTEIAFLNSRAYVHTYICT